MLHARPTLRTFALASLAVLLTFLVLDGLWLGLVARDLYAREMGGLLRESPQILPAALFYLVYTAGLVYLVLTGNPSGAKQAFLRGAVAGLMAYTAYNGTNLSVIEGFPATLAAVDLVWGTLMTGVAAAVAYAVARKTQ